MKRQSTRQKQQQNNNSTTQHSRGTTVAPSRRQRARRPRVPLAPLSLSSLLLLTLNLTLMMFSKTTTTVVRGFPLSSLPTRTTAKTTSVARRTTALSLFGATTASASSSSRRRVVTGSLADRRRSTRLRDKTSDQSSTAKSRAPFRQPKSAPDDSRPANQHNANSNAATTWTDLGVWPDVSNCLKKEMKLSAPTVVQQLVVPRLLDPTNDNSNSEGETTASSSRHVAFLAATGSGKTLAYALPVMQQLKREELEAQAAAAAESAIATNLLPKPRLHGRPRALILAPTRELCLQITTVLKQLGHTIKLSVQCVTGGDTSLGQQAKALKNKPIDVLVATPGRLRKHVEGSGGAQSVLLLSSKHLQYVVLDEMDTMLEQGFADDLAHLLYPVLYHKKYPGSNAKQNSGTLIDPNRDVVDVAPTVLLTSATLTQSIQRMLGETDKQNLVQAKRHFVRPETEAELLARSKEGHMPMRNHHNNNNASPMVLPRMTVLKAPGLHKTVPRLSQVFVDVANVDKLSLLVDVISSNRQQQPNKRPTTTMVFCNTAASCRAAEFALAEARLECLSYHGELKSTLRSDNWQSFCRNDCPILVCTDLAARGLDVPAVNHVILFDFPLNALDYLHRSGRTARGVASGPAKVTALVTKRDKVLANAIEKAVRQGHPLDGLSSRKSDYLPGGRLNTGGATSKKEGANNKRRPKSGPRWEQSKKGTKKPKPRDTTARKRGRS